MIEDEMYGIMPSAKIVAFWSAPPVNIPMKPRRFPPPMFC
ncbi:MAG: hypothetical protein BWY49_01274 [Candidatus Omnitrophica bacterium ADurb.Bin314]|nr:MAG: hypothetical protein BWY49_01274 [Candidatus Omnitrophica bacterium ADurb.Bin314]